MKIISYGLIAVIFFGISSFVISMETDTNPLMELAQAATKAIKQITITEPLAPKTPRRKFNSDSDYHPKRSQYIKKKSSEGI